jgi:hypothetical protein
MRRMANQGLPPTRFPKQGVIHGCYRIDTGRLRVIDTEAGQACGLRGKAISWNQTGERGLQGVQGVQGPQGPQGPPGFSGYQLTRAQENVAAGQHAEVTVLCPEGKRVLGGGFLVETPLDVMVGGSAPLVYGCSLRWQLRHRPVDGGCGEHWSGDQASERRSPVCLCRILDSRERSGSVRKRKKLILRSAETVDGSSCNASISRTTPSPSVLTGGSPPWEDRITTKS